MKRVIANIKTIFFGCGQVREHLPTIPYNNRLTKNAIAEMTEARLIFTSIVILNLIIFLPFMIKPKPAQAVNLSAFYSRPGWRYLRTVAAVRRVGQNQLDVIL